MCFLLKLYHDIQVFQIPPPRSVSYIIMCHILWLTPSYPQPERERERERIYFDNNDEINNNSLCTQYKILSVVVQKPLHKWYGRFCKSISTCITYFEFTSNSCSYKRVVIRENIRCFGVFNTLFFANLIATSLLLSLRLLRLQPV